MADNWSKPLTQFLSDNPDIEFFEMMLVDINGQLRGKWLPRENIEKLFKGDLKMPMSSLGFDIWGRDVGAWVLDDGDADGYCYGDISSLSAVPWLERATGQALFSMKDYSGNDSGYDPRLLLSALQKRLAKFNLIPVVATEMEFHLFQKSNDSKGRPKHSQVKITGESVGGNTHSIELMRENSELMYGIIDACKTQNLPIDTLVKEAAPSQYEINLLHQADALLAADQSILLKRAIKGVAENLDLRASFMAKPFGDLDGNGMHIHCSLIDQKGDNAFNNGSDQGNQLLQQAVAGCLASMPDCMLLFAPHLNSYRRFQSGSHAPTSPNWGYENRTVSLRIPKDEHHAMRLEHRVSGADCNPHLAIAALVAGMLYGIENKLKAPTPIEGDAYAQCEASLPRTWSDALKAFENSDFIKSYFGEAFQRVYAEAKKQEMDEFDRHVTQMEYGAYL